MKRTVHFPFVTATLYPSFCPDMKSSSRLRPSRFYAFFFFLSASLAITGALRAPSTRFHICPPLARTVLPNRLFSSNTWTRGGFPLLNGSLDSLFRPLRFPRCISARFDGCVCSLCWFGKPSTQSPFPCLFSKEMRSPFLIGK